MRGSVRLNRFFPFSCLAQMAEANIPAIATPAARTGKTANSHGEPQRSAFQLKLKWTGALAGQGRRAAIRATIAAMATRPGRLTHQDDLMARIIFPFPRAFARRFFRRIGGIRLR